MKADAPLRRANSLRGFYVPFAIVVVEPELARQIAQEPHPSAPVWLSTLAGSAERAHESDSCCGMARWLTTTM
jgi:hypothetical protein